MNEHISDRQLRRANIELSKLKEATNDIIDCKFSDDNKRSIIVSFHGPSNTKYEKEIYHLRCVVIDNDYPYKRPNMFWIGEAPDHKFYRWDKDDEGRATRCTNIGNHGCGGINHELHCPQRLIVDYIHLIRYSMTSAGEKEMYNFMQADEY